MEQNVRRSASSRVPPGQGVVVGDDDRHPRELLAEPLRAELDACPRAAPTSARSRRPARRRVAQRLLLAPRRDRDRDVDAPRGERVEGERAARRSRARPPRPTPGGGGRRPRARRPTRGPPAPARPTSRRTTCRKRTAHLDDGVAAALHQALGAHDARGRRGAPPRGRPGRRRRTSSGAGSWSPSGGRATGGSPRRAPRRRSRGRGQPRALRARRGSSASTASSQRGQRVARLERAQPVEALLVEAQPRRRPGSARSIVSRHTATGSA